MATSYKSIAIAKSIQTALNLRVAGSLSFLFLIDTDGYPYLSAGSGSPGAENVIIKVTNYLAQQNAAAVTAGAPKPYNDELNLPAQAFSPNIVAITTEAATSTATTPEVPASGTFVVTAGGSRREGVIIAGSTVNTVLSGTAQTDANSLVTAINADPVASLWVVASDAAGTSTTVTTTAVAGLGTKGNNVTFVDAPTYASGTVTYAGFTSGNITFTLAGTTTTQAFTTDNNTSVAALAAAANVDANVTLIATVTASGGVLTWTSKVPGTAGNGFKFAATATSGTATLSPVGGYATNGATTGSHITAITGSGFLTGGTNPVPVVTSATTSIIPMGDLGRILGECLEPGTIVQFLLSPEGVAPTTSNGVLAATTNSQVQYLGTIDN